MGDKIKLTDTTIKYFYITAISYSAPSTTITVNGGSNYTLSGGGVVTNVYYSRGENPMGFPSVFDYTMAWTASISNPAIGNGTLISKFRLFGKMCTYFIAIKWGSTTTSGTGSFKFSLPIQPLALGPNNFYLGSGECINETVAGYNMTVNYDNSALILDLRASAPVTGTSPFTFGTNDSLSFQGTYLTNL